MKEEKYKEAIECYTRALELDNTNAVFPCNRFAYCLFSRGVLYALGMKRVGLGLGWRWSFILGLGMVLGMAGVGDRVVRACQVLLFLMA